MAVVQLMTPPTNIYHNSNPTKVPNLVHITIAEDYNCALIKVGEGLCLFLEVRRIAGEEEEHVRLEDEEEAQLLEEVRLKYEEEDQAWKRYDKEERLSKEARQKAQ